MDESIIALFMDNILGGVSSLSDMDHNMARFSRNKFRIFGIEHF